MNKLIANTLIELEDVTTDFVYANGSEAISITNHILDHIGSVKKTPSQRQWNDAWAEIAKCDSPKYFKPRFTIDGCGIYRYKQNYIKSTVENLESKFHDHLMKNIQDRFMFDIDCVVEFGCGTGHNLQKIRSRNENISVYGSDWANSSQEILAQNNIPSWNFDMKKCEDFPYEEIFDNHDSICFLTVGSMEQIGKDWGNFLQFMLNVKPKKSIHIEPIIELYDSNNYYDTLAIKYHRQRNYLDGFYSLVSTMKELKFVERTSFGNTYNEGFTILELEYD